MPSVTDIQQQPSTASNTHGKSTPPPTTTTDSTNADPIIQVLSVLEKKQRNLGKRKEKLEAFEKSEKSGKELHKDQKDALAKLPEVLGQMECVKELSEQIKKIQIESVKYQKNLLKQATAEKRSLVSQRLREYAQLRYLLDHRPTTLKPEESTLLDELSTVINPADSSLNSISRSIDTVLSIYQGGSSATSVKNLQGRNVHDVRAVLERLIQTSEPQVSSSDKTTEQVQTKESDETNETNTETDNVHAIATNNFNEYPFQLDTRTQDVSVEQIIQNSQFLSNDLTNQSQDNDDDQTRDSNQYSQPSTGIDLNQQTSSLLSLDNQQQDNVTNLVDAHDQQGDEQWQQQQQRGNAQRGGQFSNGGGNRAYHRGRSNNYHQQWRGSRGGGYDNSYGNPSQRSYYDNNNRGRGGSNQNYRGNRGGNYRGGNRGYNNNGNGYQNPAQYHPNNNQPQQVHSAPPNSTHSHHQQQQ
ncbi:unnamed protein product [Adineta ricciae]|uniref:Uncharacterized protein n=1 Tax=Adineta ricciae TaxID=249248 RepID=A0A815TY86_ADIRI|nr:unnamed protein product [Adineta ricciae]CAF1513199.1 unnamed protein product [Adineta ricciae]